MNMAITGILRKIRSQKGSEAGDDVAYRLDFSDPTTSPNVIIEDDD